MKTLQRNLRRRRVRAQLHGTAERPRLSVHISNRQILAQLIDDDSGRTLGFISSINQAAAGKTLTEKAAWVGEQIGLRAKQAKLKRVIFDRGERMYHGRVKALAEAARKAGLDF